MMQFRAMTPSGKLAAPFQADDQRQAIKYLLARNEIVVDATTHDDVTYLIVAEPYFTEKR